jgi:hypothetical protein
MKKLLLILLCLPMILVAQDKQIRSTSYSFTLVDDPARLYSMRQFNQNYLSCYRLSTRVLENALSNGDPSNKKELKISESIQLLLLSFYLMPLTHEEGHRSILTHLKIGSISQPYMNSHGAAYVMGVTDSTLKNLRDQQLPHYIRLHNGGLESDYMLTKHMESIFAFDFDEYRYYKLEYLMRKVAILSYYIPGLFEMEIDLDEESNELSRDIVGHDIYGVAKNLFRPDIDFYRYTKYEDLTNKEKKYVDRLGYRSLLNLVSPVLLNNQLRFNLRDSIQLHFGMGHSLSPFGDFIDENIWIKFNSINIQLYARQFQNNKKWFNGCGATLLNYKINKKILSTLSGHYWQQPKEFDFNTDQSFKGGGMDLDLDYLLFINKHENWLKSFSIRLGMTYKTKGFLPEELYLDEYFGFRIGTTLQIR